MRLGVGFYARLCAVTWGGALVVLWALDRVMT